MGSAQQEEEAAAFERHVEVDEGVLVTSAPLDLHQLDVVMLQVSALKRNGLERRTVSYSVCVLCVAGERGARGVPGAEEAGERPARAAHRGEVSPCCFHESDGARRGGEVLHRTSALTVECLSRSIGSAAAVSRLLTLLESNAKALEYFKATVVGGTCCRIHSLVASSCTVRSHVTRAVP